MIVVVLGVTTVASLIVSGGADADSDTSTDRFAS